MTKSAKRGERDPVSGGKNGVHDRFWHGEESKRWFILLGLSLIIAILLFPNILIRPKIYKLGDVAARDVKASRDFLVENSKLTEQNRQEAVKDVPSVYDFDPTATNIVVRIKEAFSTAKEHEKTPVETENISEDTSTSIDLSINHFFETLDILRDDKIFEILSKNAFSVEAEQVIINLLLQVLKNGVVSNKAMLMRQSGKGIILQNIHTENETKVTDLDRFYDLGTAKDFIEGQKEAVYKSMQSKDSAKASIKLAAVLVKPNLTFNRRETELRKDLARKSVKPFYFKVKKGEMIVREGERITPKHLLMLSEQYKFLTQNEMLSRAPAMTVLIGFLLSSVYLVLFVNDRSNKVNFKDLLFNSLTLLTIFSLVIASNFVLSEIARGFPFFGSKALVFAIPVAGGAMLVSIFHGINAAACFSLIISVLAALVVRGGVEFFVFFFVSSLVAAYGVKTCNERSIFIKTGLKVGTVGIVLALSIEAIYGSLFTLEALVASASAFVGGIFVGIITTGILPLIEMSFGYTTDIKLLELANLEQPLLKELMVQAPGTYHHSVIVSNMVEAASQMINANPLLAKVAAYYHDIGKIRKPTYFIENQLDNENKHEKLAPSMSSLILISHVKEGVEMAKEARLGAELIDIIQQHHGTSLITFFYEKAREQAEKKSGKSLQIEEADFRYPGPKPQTKEAGLVMLADVVEASSRTLVDPTGARIQGMVQKSINKIFSDGQLDECELTLKDLNGIAKSFNKTLSGIFHHRVEYPESVAKGSASKKDENGNTNQVSTKNSLAKRPEDKAEDDGSLKRLGL